MAILAMTNSKDGTVFELDKDIVLIGRKTDCNIVLNEKQISKRHARILKDATHYAIEDLESRNGTFINGKRIKRMLLREGDRIKLTETVLVYHENEMQRTAKRIRRGLT
jgi:pSer/pThr/pTyr-binding forkhead associated (FHA) protein